MSQKAEKKINRQWTLASRPRGIPKNENFKLVESLLPTLRTGQVLIRTIYLSVDPYMRGRMRDVKSYVEPLKLNEVIEGGIVGKIVESKSSHFSVGDFVTARLGWQEYAVSDGENLKKLDPDPNFLSAALGVLGMPGLTAYFALLEIGHPQPGETVLVSGAAGAVGSIVGQIAKIKGCRAVGITGSDEKCRWLKEELGFDSAFNYKTASNIRKTLKDYCPNGVDIYFDNVGGPISDAAITQINMKARLVICGQISIYNRERMEMGPRNLLYLLIHRARMEGFLIKDYNDRYPEGLTQLTRWLKEGKLKHRETFVNGLENAPNAFIGLFEGKNIGKQLVKVSDL